MPILNTLREVLEGKKVPYTVHSHPTAYTAQEIAALEHVRGHAFAKVVMVKADGRLVMLVLPADHRVDFAKLKAALGCKAAALAPEAEFKELFPGSEVGAMPPFGTLYGIPVYMASVWSPDTDKEIVFNAGSHTLTVKMALRDYLALVKPSAMDFSTHL
jgi:Ala-tRNA(Pro) deacylase